MCKQGPSISFQCRIKPKQFGERGVRRGQQCLKKKNWKIFERAGGHFFGWSTLWHWKNLTKFKVKIKVIKHELNRVM